MRTILVTGGSKGIGLAIVRRFLDAGDKVITCARDDVYWHQLIADHPALASVDFRRIDLAQQESLPSLFAYIADTYGHLDVAVNNASPPIASQGPFETLSSDNILSTLLSDLWAPAVCMRHELNLMHGAGAIVNISSVNGLRPTPRAAVYSAAKHGIEGLTRSVALEAIEKGVRVNSVAPGVIWTPRWETRVAGGLVTKGEVEQAIPVRRFGTSQDIANAVFWLSSDEAKYVIGHTLVVDGGLSLI
ncbi:NAD(P)-dependent dehydrogenase (short-subunit alcohol dehydrogenase family) [Chitinivorax tropicus]|uniref:NAD(P)-dependent dehydrogenase (Short-subunit alcohol dehydrogenase family) n=1 Tax=Chitinivorax tropicus TaxID=714531 RepID=A0A840MJC8_9PROT|nr:SDR family oxidoreductase [Chitinivorax tropicus]MBB5019304.1 NAD(P)-dependent dehydrogenase (short-subunit alcohol dehydrogenase family) [Chitinivorax tropicus]